MKYTSQQDPTFTVEANPASNWDLNLSHALEAKRKEFNLSTPRGIYMGEDGRSVRVGWKNGCFQVQIIR
jgi:hypothetical protein